GVVRAVNRAVRRRIISVDRDEPRAGWHRAGLAASGARDVVAGVERRERGCSTEKDVSTEDQQAHGHMLPHRPRLPLRYRPLISFPLKTLVIWLIRRGRPISAGRNRAITVRVRYSDNRQKTDMH